MLWHQSILRYGSWNPIIHSRQFNNLCYLQVSQAQVLGRTMRTFVPAAPPEPCYAYSNYGNSDELSLLLSLAKLLDNNDCGSSKPYNNNNNDINIGAIIDKLINALVYATTQNIGNGNNNGYTGSDGGLLGALLGGLLGGSGGSSPSSGNKSNQGLIDLNLLGRDDLLKLALAGQDVLRLGLGSESSSSNKGSGNEGGLGGVLSSVL